VKLSNIAMLAAVSLAVSVPPAFAQGSRPQATNAAVPKSVRVVDAATPLRTGPGVTYPIVVTEAAGTVLDVTGREGDWYRITLSPDMVADSNAPRTGYVLARLVASAMGSTTTPQGIPTSQPPRPPQTQSRVVDAATPLRTGPGVTYPIVVTEDAGTVLEVTGQDGDWYQIMLSPDMVGDPNAPRTVYVLARLVSSVMGSIPTPQGIPTSEPPPPPQPPSAPFPAQSSRPPLVQTSNGPTSQGVPRHEALLGGHAILDYDASTWTRSTVAGEPNSFQLTNSTGDLVVKVVTSRSQVSLDKIPDLELASMQKTDPKARIIDRRFEEVDGVRMGSFQVLATVSGAESWYYTRDYSDANGTIEVIGHTASSLIQQAGPAFDKVLDGLHIVR
jgi:uncharacterized protein YgiM (DUF1202 family)